MSLIDAMDAFKASGLSEKQALIEKLFAAVWVWPDEHVWIQWHTDSEDDCERLTGGRKLYEGRKWESVDWAKIEADVRKLIEIAEIPQARFHATVPETTVYHFLKGTYERTNQSTLLKLLKVAIEEFVDAAQLRLDVTGWIRERRDEGWSWYRLEKETSLVAATIQKIAKGGSVRRNTFIVLADKVGGLDQYTDLPSWVYVPPFFDELIEWHVRVEEREGNESLGDTVNTSTDI